MISDQLTRELTEHCLHYPSKRVGLIHVLQKLQEHYGGWLPDEAIGEAAKITGVGPAEVEGTATFYNWLFRRPVGKIVIACCDSIACYIAGSDRLIEYLEVKLGTPAGGTTADGRFTLVPVVCLGDCNNAPSILVNGELHNKVTREKIDEILAKLQPEAS